MPCTTRLIAHWKANDQTTSRDREDGASYTSDEVLDWLQAKVCTFLLNILVRIARSLCTPFYLVLGTEVSDSYGSQLRLLTSPQFEGSPMSMQTGIHLM